MKLTQEEIHQIELYLESKELYQIDLKQEVLDHIANAIEERMEQGTSFVNAFYLEQSKWHKSLDGSSHLLIGNFFGPKVLIDKATKVLKSFYGITAIFMGLIAAMLFLIYLFSNKNFELMERGIGGAELFFIGIAVFCLIRIQTSGYNTTYRLLFRRFLWTIAIVCLIANPLYSKLFKISSGDGLEWIYLFLHILFLSQIFGIFYLYKMHISLKKLMLV